MTNDNNNRNNNNSGMDLSNSFLDQLSLPPEKVTSIKEDAGTFKIKGARIIHSEETRDKVVDSLRNSTNPVEAIANTSLMVVQAVDDLAKRTSKTKIDPLAKIEGANFIVNEVMNIGQVSRALPEGLTEDHRDAALAVLVQNYVKQAIDKGEIDRQELSTNIGKMIQSMPEEQRNTVDSQIRKIHETATTTKVKSPFGDSDSSSSTNENNAIGGGLL